MEKLYYTLPQLEAVRDFFELGGDVLLLIGVLTLVMWGLIFERLLYFAVRYPRVARATIEKWDELEALGVEVIRGDIRDRDAVAAACRGIDCVFHTAAVAGIGGPWRKFHEVNVLGTEHVLEACRTQGGGFFGWKHKHDEIDVSICDESYNLRKNPFDFNIE